MFKILVVVILCVANMSFAEEICKDLSLAECHLIRAQILNEIKNKQREIEPTIKILYGISRGSIYEREASEACLEQGKGLPTARDFAEVGAKFGAQILEVNEVDSKNLPLGFDEINVVNADGTKDIFYYSNDNYDPPKNFGNVRSHLWSSSIPMRGETKKDWERVTFGLNSGLISSDLPRAAIMHYPHKQVWCKI